MKDKTGNIWTKEKAFEMARMITADSIDEFFEVFGDHFSLLDKMAIITFAVSLEVQIIENLFD